MSTTVAILLLTISGIAMGYMALDWVMRKLMNGVYLCCAE